MNNLTFEFWTDNDGDPKPYNGSVAGIIAQCPSAQCEFRPNTLYRLYLHAEEVEAKPEYPRYFIKETTRYYYWRFDSPTDGFVVNYTGAERKCYPNLTYYETVAREVTKSEAEAHIRDPEKCVWKEKEDLRWEPQCTHGPSWVGENVEAMTYCPLCTKPVKMQSREPTIPPSYREPEEWEKECAEPPANMMAREKGTGEWLRGWKRKRWPSENFYDQIFVPADWTPLPKCRDCGEPTTIVEGAEGEGYNVECAVTKGCTMGPVMSTKSEAVNAYPKGE